MCLATKRHFMFVIGAIGLRDTTQVPNNLCHGKISTVSKYGLRWVPGPALVTKKKYCEIEGNRVQNVD